MAMKMPPDTSNILVEMGKLQQSITFVLQTLDKLQGKIDQSKSANEIEAKWEEQDRRIEETAGNVRELQAWRVSLYQQSGKEQIEVDRSISGIKQINSERTITMTQALISLLVMALIGLLVYIAENVH